MKISKKRSPMSIRFSIIASGIAIILLLIGAIIVTTYLTFSFNTKESVTTQVKELSSQIVYNYENYINTIIETSNAIQIKLNRIDVKNNSDDISNYFNGIVNIKNEILNISVYDNRTRRCYASSDSSEVGRVIEEFDSWFYQANEEETIHIFSVPYSDNINENVKLNISKQIKYNKSADVATLRIEISFENFINLVKKSNLGNNGHINIIDSNYNIVYTSAKSINTQDEISIAKSLILGSKDVVIDRFNMRLNIETLTNTKWRMCVFINTDKIAMIEKNFITNITVVSVFVLILAVIIFLSVSKRITRPLKKLENTMLKIENTNYFLMKEVNLQSGKEVVALSKSFNKMMKKLQELMDRVVYEQNEQRKSELKALQNQINPHFLYNTLDSIIWLIDNEKNEEATTMVVALAKLFRIGISRGNNLISVKDELEHVRNYLFIQNIRYSDSFDYDFDVDERVFEYATLKVLLQPLVENAIYHGVKNKIDKGKILITAKFVDNKVVMSVSDNGYGIKQSKINDLYNDFEDMTPAQGVGLKNIYLRLKIFYSNRAEFRIESELDEGTTITIIQPIGDE